MSKPLEFTVKVHPTKDSKKLKTGIKNYDYGAINIRAPELLQYVGTTVKVRIEKFKKA